MIQRSVNTRVNVFAHRLLISFGADDRYPVPVQHWRNFGAFDVSSDVTRATLEILLNYKRNAVSRESDRNLMET